MILKVNINRPKMCRTCLKSKPFNAFGKTDRRNTITGKKSSCIECEEARDGTDWKEQKILLREKRQKDRDIKNRIKKLSSLSARKKELYLEIRRLTAELNKLLND